MFFRRRIFNWKQMKWWLKRNGQVPTSEFSNVKKCWAIDLPTQDPAAYTHAFCPLRFIYSAIVYTKKYNAVDFSTSLPLLFSVTFIPIHSSLSLCMCRFSGSKLIAISMCYFSIIDLAMSVSQMPFKCYCLCSFSAWLLLCFFRCCC